MDFSVSKVVDSEYIAKCTSHIDEIMNRSKCYSHYSRDYIAFYVIYVTIIISVYFSLDGQYSSVRKRVCDP